MAAVAPEKKMAKRDESGDAPKTTQDGQNTEDDSKGKRPAKHDAGAADLEKVTDFHEETEITDIGDAMRVVSDKKASEAAEKLRREKELSKVKISKEDVELIIREMEIARSIAERKLREHKGDVVQALIELTN